MAQQTWQRKLGFALEAAVPDRRDAEQNGGARRRVKPGRATDPDRAHPLEFDESGFPIPQDNPSFAARVARLLNSS
jgi:hypothetical protein